MEGNMYVLLDVISVVPRENHTLHLTFENNEQRVFDMAPHLDFKPYRKLRLVPLFMKARVENGTVVWPGNIDIAPETLWECSQPA
jgi:hypothetical protein